MGRTFTGRHALVTGAGGGLGRAVALELARLGGSAGSRQGVACARSGTRRRARRGGPRGLGAGRRTRFRRLAPRGRGQPHGPDHVIDAFVPAMVRAGRGGHLVNVASAAALVGLPWHAPCSASKYGLRGLSDVLRSTFDATASPSPSSARAPSAPRSSTPSTSPDSTGRARLQRRFRHHADSAEDVALATVEGMLAGRYLVHTSRPVQVVHALERVAPPVYVLTMRAAHAVADRALRQATRSGRGAS